MDGLLSRLAVFLCVCALLHARSHSAVPAADSTVSEFDARVYDAVTIGAQTWLLENLRCLHYCDGTVIPEVASHHGSDSREAIDGRLYTRDARREGVNGGGRAGRLPLRVARADVRRAGGT